MSGYILCQTKKADKPFFVESINTNIYSLEELCYFLYHNLYLVDSSIINENLCTWISEELDLPRLAAKLRPHLGKFASAEDVLYPVFKEINYLTYEELKGLNVKLSKLDQEAPLLRKKRKGDALVSNKMYVSAIKVYQQLLKKEGLEHAPTLKKDIMTLKSEIKGLGNVNVNAIEDYKELSERHTFLAAQHEDLLKAEEALIKIIEELDEGMRTQFKAQFARIQTEFDKAFKELFGGGRGTLELVEDEDILEAGVRIIAQPPGKKLQNMMQLSGGEKSLTAIALLFAIQNLKPSPFCLLDEIEAALDESNVDRYANYLHKLTENTQFIIITHRRGTMTAADRLYGITMQEKGVSALVSVNLIEDDLDN